MGGMWASDDTPRQIGNLLKSCDADVVCIQEAHDGPDPNLSQLDLIAECAGFEHAVQFGLSSSHLRVGERLSLGLLSHGEIANAEVCFFPNPRLRAVGPDGEQWMTHDKGCLTCTVDSGIGRIGVMNVHMFPFHHFGYSAGQEDFSEIWTGLARQVGAIGLTNTLVVCGDLNSDPLPDGFTVEMRKQDMQEVLGDNPTTRGGLKQDYIFAGQRLMGVSSGVIDAPSDHHLCWTRLVKRPEIKDVRLYSTED